MTYEPPTMTPLNRQLIPDNWHSNPATFQNAAVDSTDARLAMDANASTPRVTGHNTDAIA